MRGLNSNLVLGLIEVLRNQALVTKDNIQLSPEVEVTSGGYLPSHALPNQCIYIENFSFKQSKLVKNTLYLRKSTRTVTHEC